MSPIKVNRASTEETPVYGNPFRGPVNHTAQIGLVLTGFTDREIDSQGYLKPGVPVRSTGALISGSGQAVFGVTIEALKVGAGNSAEDIAAMGTQEVAVAIYGALNRAIIEENLGEALSTNEVNAFAHAECELILLGPGNIVT
jgi:hypothetical protein